MLKTLVVDEDLDTRISTTGILRKLACEVETHAQPQLAFSLIAYFNPYDVIFIALNMRQMRGMEFARAVLNKYPDARVILTSSTVPSPETQREIEAHRSLHTIFSEHTIDHYRTVLVSALETPASH